MRKEGIKIYPKRLPPDIRQIIFKVQADVKKDCLCQFSQEQVIYKLIRLGAKQEEHDRDQTA